MSWASRFRRRELLRTSFWIIPAAYVVAALVLADQLPALDASTDVGSLPFAIDPSSARDTLSAISSGMIAFTGFVFSTFLVLVQFGSQAFSPRAVSFFRRAAITKHALGAFIATFVYSLSAIGEVGKGGSDAVPVITYSCALGFVLLSVALFLALIQRTVLTLRAASALDGIGRRTIECLHETAPDPFDPAPPERDELPRLPARPTQVVRHTGPPSVLQAVDDRALVRAARRVDGVLLLLPAVGSLIRTGQPVLALHGATDRVPDRRLRRTLILGDERTLQDDAAFGLRLLVDIAIKALSPAVNDPTTASAALDRIEAVLGDAAHRDLDARAWRDRDGVVRLRRSAPTWEDLVSLGVDEVRVYGRRSLQTCRRLRALLEDLAAVVPAPRRPALDAELARLEATVARNFPDAGDRALASRADAIGMGLGRTTGPRRAAA